MVFLSYAYAGAYVTEQFAWSFALASKNPLVKGMLQAGGYNLPMNRNLLVKQFLSQGSDVAQWLLMLDSDMLFPPTVVDTLVNIAHEWHADVAAAVYPTLEGKATAAMRFEKGWVMTNRWKHNEVRLVDGVGMGCTLISRNLLERLGTKHVAEAWQWFGYDPILLDGKPDRQSDDYTFCERAKKLDPPATIVAAHVPNVCHVKPCELVIETFDEKTTQ